MSEPHPLHAVIEAARPLIIAQVPRKNLLRHRIETLQKTLESPDGNQDREALRQELREARDRYDAIVDEIAAIGWEIRTVEDESAWAEALARYPSIPPSRHETLRSLLNERRAAIAAVPGPHEAMTQANALGGTLARLASRLRERRPDSADRVLELKVRVGEIQRTLVELSQEARAARLALIAEYEAQIEDLKE